MLRTLISNLLAAWRGRRIAATSQRGREFVARDTEDGTRTGASLEDRVRHAEALAAAGRLNAALECYRECLRIDPQGLRARLGMANLLVDLWSIEEAVAAYDKALALAPHSSAIRSALLFHSHYLNDPDPARLFALHRRFGEVMHAERSDRANAAFAPAADRAGRIRVGYVSPNFSRHSVGYFVEPVIRHHDRSCYEIYCYYNHHLADETTGRIRELADGWREIADQSDDTVEQIIRSDCIDVLVDLAGHSKGNRLGVFARKPAPTQMTWLGYPDTTGLDAIEYRITDRLVDPEPDAQQRHTERLLPIDDVFLCYGPPEDSPPVSALVRPPSEIVFASFNNVAKVNEPTIRIWGQILSEVPGSRLILKSAPLGYPDTADRVLECCERNGVDPARIELKGWVPGRRSHLGFYAGVDIALDTFPYNGTTTTCEALWMGVPVVSLAGAVHMSRVGATILQCAGLSEFVAETKVEYVAIAVALARDHARRESLRTNLRSILRASPLLDHAGFTRKLERRINEAHARRTLAARV